MAGLKQEIAQRHPFASREEEVLLNLMRTADCFNRALQRTTREWGITGTQYNVLRILRGAHPQGLPCAAIGHRMITAEPDITRLLARLKALKLIRQQRDRKDRRIVLTFISATGLDLLQRMEPAILNMPDELLGHLGENDLVELTRLLELARSRCGQQHPASTPSDPVLCEPPSCDGSVSLLRLKESKAR